MLRPPLQILVSALLLAACARKDVPRANPLPLSPSLAARLAPAARALDSAIAAGAAPGAVLEVSYKGERFTHAVGKLAVDDPRAPDGRTLYDMASLTKVVATTTLAMFAVHEGRMALDTPVVRYLPEFARGKGEKSAVTVRNLLLHNSGLPPDPVPGLWVTTKDRPSAIVKALEVGLDTVPGARMVYSDINAIALATILERSYGKRLDKLFDERVARPLGLARMRFLPPAAWRPEIAATEIEAALRGPIALRGEVHDENAWWMQGVSGHAGLFSDADDLLRFGEWALAGALGKPVSGALQPPAEFAQWTVRQSQPSGSSRAIGWDTALSRGSSAGRLMSERSFGHTGFTGTSIWIDPTRELVVVLLTNRVNPTRTTPRFGQIRSVIADAVVRSLEPNAIAR